MTLDVVNVQNEKVGDLEVDEAIFGGRVRTGLIWEAVVHQNAAERSGTHSTKTRGLVRGSGKKPWRQKGTGRARVGSVRNPLWKGGGTVFGPRPRSYDYRLPRKVRRAGLREALSQKVQEGAVTLLDQLAVEEVSTKAMAELLSPFERGGRTLIVDVHPDETVERSTRNITGVSLVRSGRLTARDVIGARTVLMTRAAFERLQNALGTGTPASETD
jgi:large subunit ribosomal protein L4